MLMLPIPRCSSLAVAKSEYWQLSSLVFSSGDHVDVDSETADWRWLPGARHLAWTTSSLSEAKRLAMCGRSVTSIFRFIFPTGLTTCPISHTQSIGPHTRPLRSREFIWNGMHRHLGLTCGPSHLLSRPSRTARVTGQSSLIRRAGRPGYYTPSRSSWPPPYLCGVPMLPAVPGMADFKGVIRHSTAHDSSRDFVAKKVCVVGTSSSGFDTTFDCSRRGIDVTLLQRSPTYIMSLTHSVPLPSATTLRMPTRNVPTTRSRADSSSPPRPAPARSCTGATPRCSRTSTDRSSRA